MLRSVTTGALRAVEMIEASLSHMTLYSIITNMTYLKELYETDKANSMTDVSGFSFELKAETKSEVTARTYTLLVTDV